MDIPALPYELCVKIANDAVKLAVLKAPRSVQPRGNDGRFQKLKQPHGYRGLFPIATKDGQFGIGIRAWAYHMEFQNSGIKPFTMWSLEGKTVPIRLPDGRVIFRVAKGVGKPGRIANRDEKGRIMKGNVGVKWRHPGLKPKNFIEDSLTEAIKLHEDEIVYFLITSAARGEQ